MSAPKLRITLRRGAVSHELIRRASTVDEAAAFAADALRLLHTGADPWRIDIEPEDGRPVAAGSTRPPPCASCGDARLATPWGPIDCPRCEQPACGSCRDLETGCCFRCLDETEGER